MGIVSALLLAFLAYGIWNYKNWSKTILFILSLLTIFGFLITEIFNFSIIVFAGEEITPFKEIIRTFVASIMNFLAKSSIPIIIVSFLKFNEDGFEESQEQRNFLDKFIKKALLVIASSSIFIVAMIFLFTFLESTDAISQIGLEELLTGTIWRPGAIIGSDEGQFGLVPMVIGSIYSTIGAVILGVPLSILTAILLAEIAPPLVRDFFRTAVELLAGIPSVIFGLFGMVVIAPLIRNIEIAGNSGFGILNASIILATIILPTITNVT